MFGKKKTIHEYHFRSDYTWVAYKGDTLLVIISSTNYFFDSRPQQNGVLKLCRVAALDIAKWRVRINDTNIAQVLQCKQIPCLQKKETNHFSSGMTIEISKSSCGSYHFA